MGRNPRYLKQGIQMTRQEIRSEVERLKALVDFIPTQARMAYEKNVLGGRALEGVIQSFGTILKRMKMFSMAPFVALGMFFFLIVMFHRQIAGIPAALFPWVTLVITAMMLAIFGWSWRRERDCERSIQNCRQVFQSLERYLSAIGLHPTDLVEGQVRSRLQYLVTAVVTAQRLFDALCSAEKFNRYQVIAAVPSVSESELELRQAICSARFFGFDLNQQDLIRWADDNYP